MITAHLIIYVHNTGGGDYTIGPYDVMIPAGSTKIPFDVLIIGDKILEQDEQFRLVIFNPLLDRVTVNHPNQSIVTIMDNDRKLTHLVDKNLS